MVSKFKKGRLPLIFWVSTGVSTLHMGNKFIPCRETMLVTFVVSNILKYNFKNACKHFSKKCVDPGLNAGHSVLKPELYHGANLATDLVGKKVDVIGYYKLRRNIWSFKNILFLTLSRYGVVFIRSCRTL